VPPIETVEASSARRAWSALATTVSSRRERLVFRTVTVAVTMEEASMVLLTMLTVERSKPVEPAGPL
jgi:hypothetical protein